MSKQDDKKLLSIEDLIFFGNILKKYSQPIPKSKLNLSNDFIKCARRDLRASKLLFEKKLYPEYAYHLQQSVEKIAKAYVISLNSLSDSQINKIKHKTPKAFIKVLEKEFQIFDILNKLGGDFKSNFADLNTIINSPKESQKIALSKNNEIKILLDEYSKLIGKIDFSSLELNKNSVKNVNDASKYVIDQTELDKQSKISFKRILKKIFTNKSVQKNVMNKKLRDSTEEFVKNLVGLYFLAILTYPHESYTRYPDRELTPFKYKKTIGICQHKDRLIKLLYNSIKVIEKDNKNKKIKSD